MFHTADVPPPPPGIAARAIEGPPGLTAAVAMGAALAERMLAARFGRSLVDHRTWLLTGAAELAAGQALEAAAIAASVPLGRLAIVARVQTCAASLLARYTALGWTLRRVAAGDEAGFEAAMAAAQRAQKPTLIACFGESPTDLEPPPAEGPTPTAPPRMRGAAARRAWLKRLRRHGSAAAFERAFAGQPGPGWTEALAAPAPGGTPLEAVIDALRRVAPHWPEIAGLRPDLPADAEGLAWPATAQAELGGLLGMAVHGGLVPVGQVERLSADAALPAQRAAAAADLRTLHMVIDDGPLPAGLLAAWRALPGTRLFRPADAAEALECLDLALRHAHAPSILLLSTRAATLQARPRGCLRGGYVLHQPARRDVTLIAAGGDMPVALAVRGQLLEAGCHAAVVSLPCWHLFTWQTAEYRRSVLGDAPRVGLEGGDSFGWGRLLGEAGLFVDLRGGGDPATIARTIVRFLRRPITMLDNSADLLESGAYLA